MRTPQLHLLTLAVCGSILLTGCSQTGTTNSANTNASPSVAACETSALTASLNGIEGTAGTYYTTLTVTNTGTTSCLFKGTAKLALLSATTTELGNVSSPSADLTLTPGQSIYASVAFPDASNYADSNACKSGGVIVNFYAPGQTTPIQAYDTRTVRANWTVHACPGFALNAFATTKP